LGQIAPNDESADSVSLRQIRCVAIVPQSPFGCLARFPFGRTPFDRLLSLAVTLRHDLLRGSYGTSHVHDSGHCGYIRLAVP
jgi:hypothetical protein